MLGKIQDRIWIPFFVGLEFQQNRFKRVVQSEKHIKSLLDKIQNTAKELSDEVESIELEKRAVGLEDVQERLKAVRDSHLSLSETVELVYKKVPLVSLDDDIANRICDLFEGRIGAAVENQNKLDEMLVGADERYVNSIPPGFRDSKKDGTVFWGGVVYPQKYGDFIIWKQVIDHVLNSGDKKVVFVTGDRKEDWWFKVEGKSLGPHPLLVEEIFRIGKVDTFWMYSSDQFLQYAERYLRATEVTKETIDQVKELASGGGDLLGAESLSSRVFSDIFEEEGVACDYKKFMERLANVAHKESRANVDVFDRLVDCEVNVRLVARWAKDEYSLDYLEKGDGCFEFLGEVHGKRVGFFVKEIMADSHSLRKNANKLLLAGYSGVAEGFTDGFVVAFVVPDGVSRKIIDFEWNKAFLEDLWQIASSFRCRGVVVGGIVDGKFNVVKRVRS